MVENARPVTRTRSVGMLALATMVTFNAYAAAPDLSGYWMVENYVEELRTVDGKEPPLTPQAKALYEQRKADSKAGKKADFDRTAAKCINPGLPRLMFLPYAVEFCNSSSSSPCCSPGTVGSAISI
jgi:hypothetical protein